jgi:hypothetical protein
MIPFLTYPLALLGLAALPALAAIYILRNRYRRRQVSSLLLWRFNVQSKSGGAKIHRLQLPLLFFLELLTLTLLVTAATGPRWKLPQSTRPLIVVLDDSLSMRALDRGITAQARAREYLERLFRRQAPPSTRLILAGAEPRLGGALARNWRELADILPQWKCSAPTAALDAAMTLAAELGRQQANILVLTDHAPAGQKISNRRLEWRAFGEPLENFAIVNASRTAFEDQDRCLLEVANYSSAARTARLSTQAGTNPPQSMLLELGARESQRVVFNLPSAAPLLRASLEPDALAEDNEVQLLPPVRRRVRVQVALTNEVLAALVNRTLDAAGLRAALNDPPEIMIHDSDSPVPSDAWGLVLTHAGGTNAYTGPFVIDTSHPLAKGIGLNGVVWAASAATNVPGDVPIILAGNTPLLSTREDALGRRHLTFNCNPALSTVQNTPAWPILFWNILSWRIAEMPGLRESNVRLGAEILLQTTGEPVTVIQPDGERKLFPKSGGDLSLETPALGLYTVASGLSTNRFAVNALDAEESDLTACVSGQWGQWSEETERRIEETSAVWIMGLLALILLTAHLCLVAGVKGGS